MWEHGQFLLDPKPAGEDHRTPRHCISRILEPGPGFIRTRVPHYRAWALAGALAAFAGVIVGKRVLHTITIATVQGITGALLMLIAALLGLGVI